MNEQNIYMLFEKWNNTLQTGTAKDMTNLYTEDAILLPTISNKVRHNHREIEDYFIQFQEKQPTGKINESNIRDLGHLAIHSGIYTFSFKNQPNVKARFTFVYKCNEGNWKIIEHHSSAMPEAIPNSLNKTY